VGREIVGPLLGRRPRRLPRQDLPSEFVRELEAPANAASATLAEPVLVLARGDGFPVSARKGNDVFATHGQQFTSRPGSTATTA